MAAPAGETGNSLPHRVALVVYMSTYDKKPLANAANDAKRMAEMLENLSGFQVTLLENSDRSRLCYSIDQFIAKLHSNSIVIFYYAGHGMIWQNEHYMMCTDYEMFAADSMCSSAGVCIDVAIKRLSMAVKKGVVIALLDTCRVLPTVDGMTRGPAAVTEDTRKMNIHDFDGDVLVGYACARLAAAQDGGNNGHGLYTQHVLQTVFDPKYDSILTALGAAHKAVKAATDKIQRPQLESEDPTPFTRIRLVDPKPAPVSPQAVQPQGNTGNKPSSTASSPTRPVAPSPFTAAAASSSAAAAAGAPAAGSTSPSGAFGATPAGAPAFCFGAPPSAFSSRADTPVSGRSGSSTPTSVNPMFMFGASLRAGSEGLVSPSPGTSAIGTMPLATAASAPGPGAVGDGVAVKSTAGMSVTDLIQALKPCTPLDKQKQALSELCSRARSDAGSLTAFTRNPDNINCLVGLLASHSLEVQLSAAELLSRLCEEHCAVQTALGGDEALLGIQHLFFASEAEARAAGAQLTAAAAAQHEGNTAIFAHHQALIQKLVAALRDAKQVRTYAAAALSNIVQDKSPEVRNVVANEPGVAKGLLVLLKSSSPVAQKHAAAALAYISRCADGVDVVTDEPGVFEHTKKLLQNNDLWHFGGDMITSFLVTNGDSNLSLRANLVADGEVLALLASRLHQAGLRGYHAITALGAIAAASADACRAILQISDGAVVRDLIAKLGIQESANFIKDIGSGQRSPGSICEAAAIALARISRNTTPDNRNLIGQQGAVQKLVALLGSGVSSAKEAALRGLGELAEKSPANQQRIAQQPTAVPDTLAFLSSLPASNDSLRGAACIYHALRALGCDERFRRSMAQYVGRLVLLLGHDQVQYRHLAVCCINKLVVNHPDNQTRVGRERGVITGLLRLAYRDRDVEVRSAAINTLQWLAHNHPSNQASIRREAEGAGYVQAQRQPLRQAHEGAYRNPAQQYRFIVCDDDDEDDEFCIDNCDGGYRGGYHGGRVSPNEVLCVSDLFNRYHGFGRF